MTSIQQYYQFIKEAEKLKSVTRTAWSQKGRRESTAEHSWRLALFAGIISEDYPKLNITKVLMMCLIHDIGELEDGDVSAVLRPDSRQKDQKEIEAAKRVFSLLPSPSGERLLKLLEEYQEAQTPEARLVKALDKAETIIQHNQGMNPEDFNYEFNLSYGEAYFKDDPVLKELKCILDHDTRKKINKR